MNIIFTCLVTLTTCHSLPCLPSSKRFCPLLTIREALDLPIPLLSHHLSSFRHKTHKALTVSLQRERSCSKLFLCLPAPECFRSPPSVVFSPVVSKTNLLWQHRSLGSILLYRENCCLTMLLSSKNFANFLIQLYNTSAQFWDASTFHLLYVYFF